MQIRISTLGIKLLNIQEEQIKEELSSLQRFTKRFGTSAVLNLIIKKVTPHQAGDVYLVQASLAIPGKDITIEVEGNSIEATVNELRDKLKYAIIENRKIKESKWRKFARKLKDKLRFVTFRH